MKQIGNIVKSIKLNTKDLFKGKHCHGAPLSTLATALLSILLLAGCAKQGYPSGGPKDVTPPMVIGTEPTNGSTHFTAKEFVINCNEYVQVRDAENNIIVSPPMKHKPEYGTRGKSILVRIKDTLRENTTYLFQFKEGIADFNEGNPLKSYEYAFSTGEAIDSMTIRGTVLDAFNGKAHEEAVTVAAYGQWELDTAMLGKADSIVATSQPTYMTRCDKEGNFELNHLRQGRYLLIAYEDADKNLRLGPDDPVAFLDTLVLAQKMPAPIDTSRQDSTSKDSTIVADSLNLDSTATTLADSTAHSSMEQAPTPVHLLISADKQIKQRIAKSAFKRKGLIEIITMAPVSDSFAVVPLDDRHNPADLYIKINHTRDTFSIWPAKEGCDSIVLLVTDTNLHDTIKLQHREKKMSGKSMSTKLTPATMKSLVNGQHPYFDSLWVAFENPMVPDTSVNDTSVVILSLTDSTTTRCGLRWANDLRPEGSSRAWINFAGKAGEKYKFVVHPKQFTDIYGHLNPDSLVISTEYTKADNYGNIILDIALDTADSTQVLIQLADEKGDLIAQQAITTSQKVTFAHHKEGKYAIRAVIDTDGNGKWTPGNYWQQRQPERVVPFEKILELRENWDMEEKWEVR